MVEKLAGNKTKGYSKEKFYSLFEELWS